MKDEQVIYPYHCPKCGANVNIVIEYNKTWQEMVKKQHKCKVKK